MAITDVINGSDVYVFISPVTGTTTWTAAAHATSHSLSVKMATRDTSNKGSGVYVTRDKARVDVTGSMEGMYIDSDKYNIEDFYTIMTTRVPVLMLFTKSLTTLPTAPSPSTSTAGGAYFYASGKFWVTSIDSTFPDAANSTYTVTFEHCSGFQMNKLITT
jgi:hypothetical protein